MTRIRTWLGVLPLVWALGVWNVMGSSAADARAHSAPRDALTTLQAFHGRLERGTAAITGSSIDELASILEGVRVQWALEPARGPEFAAALLDLAGHTLALYDPAGRDDLVPESIRARTVAVDVLARKHDAELARWLAIDVLARANSAPLPRRRAAAWFLIGRRRAEQELALLGCTRDTDPRLCSIAAEALVGSESEAVHQFFLDALGRAEAPSDVLCMLAERHLRKVRFEPDSKAARRLEELVRLELIAADWRSASRAITLSHAFDDAAIVPWLIEALGTWKSRADKGLQGLRVAHDLEAELESRSGRKLGLHPENWLAWWEAARRGTVKKAATPSGFPEPTRPSFFGLEPKSDRVLFVIDRSGSMEGVFDPKEQSPDRRVPTRFEKAALELTGFVETLGPRARFGIVVFHDFADPWKEKLVAADERNREAARRWLELQKPKGGTRLRAGIDLGLAVGPDGRPSPEAVEADTVIVLCDGATSEGSGWVGPWLRRHNGRIRVRFHGVQIGEGGDGTLEELARETGGDFVRIVK